MANVVEIVVQGNDRTGPAMTSAINNTRRVGAEMKSLGAAINQAGAAAEMLGGQQFGSVINAMGGGITAARELVNELGKSRAAMLALGVVAVGTGVAIGTAIGEALEARAKKQREEQIEALEMVQDAQMEILAGKNSELAAYVKINQKLDEQAQKLMRMKNITTDQFIQSADALNARREDNRIRYVKTADDEIAKNRKAADDAYEKAQELISENDRKRKEEDFKRYLTNLDEQIKAEVDAKKQIADEVNADADAAEEEWRKRNSGRIEQMIVTEELFNNSIANLEQALRSFSARAALSVSDGIGNAVASIATGAMSAADAFKQFGKEMLGMLAKSATQMVVNAVLAQTLQSSFAVTSAAIATAVASAWSTAAAMVSLASYGANAIPAAAGIISTVSLSKGLALVGQAHAGMDYVPSEGSYNLQRGEMVLDPGTSDEVRDAAVNGAGGGSYVINWNVDSVPLAKLFLQWSRDGRLTISQKAVTA